VSKKVVIELNDYVASRLWDHNGVLGLWDRPKGLAAAKKFKINTLTDPGTVLVLKVLNGVRMDEVFIRALLGALARKVGPKALLKRVKVEGGYQGGRVGYHDIASTTQQIKTYLLDEEKKIAVRAAKKAKDDNPNWSKSTLFFIPDIGTRVKLTKDWTFRLFEESRNYYLWQALGLKQCNRSWRYDNPMTEKKVVINAGSVLKVNRLYIRQGAKEYSSVTFNLQKGSEVNGDAVMFKKKGCRFWAKLSDVNKMEVSVDKASLAEN